MSVILNELHQIITDFMHPNEECNLYYSFISGDMDFNYFLISATDFVLQKYGLKQLAFPYSEFMCGAETYERFDTTYDDWRESFPSDQEMPALTVDEYLERLCQYFPELLAEASPAREVLVFFPQPSNFKSRLVSELLQSDRFWYFEHFESGTYRYLYYIPQDGAIDQKIDRSSIMSDFLSETFYAVVINPS
jgi:hypothetical protein